MGKKGVRKSESEGSAASEGPRGSTAKKGSVVEEAEKRGSASAEPGGADDAEANEEASNTDGAEPPRKSMQNESTSSSPYKVRKFLRDGPPPVPLEDAKLRLARTMDRMSYLNHTKMGLTNLISRQNSRVRTILEHKSDVAPLATALRGTVSEAEQFIDAQTSKQQASGVLLQRLKIIDAYTSADFRRKAKVYETPVETTLDQSSRSGFSAKLPSYYNLMNRPFLDPGQERPHCLMAVTCVTAPRYLVPRIPRSSSEPGQRKLMSQTM